MLVPLSPAPAGARAGSGLPVHGARNPILPGYFADPSIIRHKGEWFVFATIDPWGEKVLGLWRSRDFRNWTFATPDWPTKAAATSSTSGKSGVWAPSVVKGRDGRFWMYVTVGNEIWAGVAKHPAGPWADANGGRPLIPRHFRPGYHMIDAEAFIDDDGQAYLYWGSGLNWVNGHCLVVKLKPDMVSFDGEPRDVTPAHYFEAPFMLKRGGHYFLTYSWGNTTTDTYQVRYAVGASPLGPFTEPADAPLLATDTAERIISPGHHAVFRAGGQDLILYHRQGLPFPRPGRDVLRQVAVDRLEVIGNRIATVRPTHDGPDVPGTAPYRHIGKAYALTASSALDVHPATAAGDDDYATGWQAAPGSSWLQADRGRVGMIGPSLLRPAYPTRTLRLTLEASNDGTAWRTIGSERSVSGSPIVLPSVGRGRFVRLRFADDPAILEWTFR